MITKAPKNKEAGARKLFFTSSARVAWGHLLEQLDIKHPFKVLLPSYIGYTDREGSGVFDPIEATNQSYSFYSLNDNLSINIGDFESQIKAGIVKVALVIHYFGFCQNDIVAIASLCKQYDVLLVEDCAHAFQLGLPGQRLGVNGDFSFYSLHKYLATDTGGILQINNLSFNIQPISEGSRISLDVLEQYIKTDIIQVAEIRRSNYQLYLDELSNLDGIEIFISLDEYDIPHNFPIKIKHGRREKLYFHLINDHIPVIALYYRMIDQIDRAQFPVSFQISDSILNLPVHQDINKEDVGIICNAIKRFFILHNDDVL